MQLGTKGLQRQQYLHPALRKERRVLQIGHVGGVDVVKRDVKAAADRRRVPATAWTGPGGGEAVAVGV